MAKGICNICLQGAKLTEDHVPPQGSVDSDELEVRNLADYLQIPQPAGRPGRTSLVYRTICEECNSDRLGIEYDPSLKDFAESVALWMRARQAGMALPSAMTIPCKPQRIGRAIAGHMLAARGGKGRNVTAPLPAALRQFVLDAVHGAPATLRLFVWPYPGLLTVVIPNFAQTQLGSRETIIGDTLKFFPVGFWMVYNLPSATNSTLCEVPLTFDDPDAEVELRIPLLNRVPPSDWPEVPLDKELTFVVNEDSFVATRRQRT